MERCFECETGRRSVDEPQSYYGGDHSTYHLCTR